MPYVTGSVSFPAKPVSVAPEAPTEIPAAAIGTPARNLRAEAIIRAALLHRAGRRDLLLFNMREQWDAIALDYLGYFTIDEVIAEVKSRGSRP